MSGKLTRAAYEALIAENVAWLEQMPRTLEREHIKAVLLASPAAHYETTALDSERAAHAETRRLLADAVAAQNANAHAAVAVGEKLAALVAAAEAVAAGLTEARAKWCGPESAIALRQAFGVADTALRAAISAAKGETGGQP